MSDTVWLGIIVATPPTIIALTGLVVVLKAKKQIGKIETQTNSMNEKMVESAKKEGKAEVLETLAAAAPAIPLAITPVANDPKVMEWINMGIQIEAARRVANGLPKAPDSKKE